MSTIPEALSPEQEYFARVILQNRVYSSVGQAYQDLFVAVMTRRYPDFRPVKPQGRLGDQGNDGFIAATGEYYQVYAPEDPGQSVATAAKKATDDFAKLKQHWEQDAPIRAYRFVFNDRFRGSYPEVEHALSQLKNEHRLDVSEPFLAKDLEREFMGLSASDMQAVLSTVIPRSQYIEDIDYAALSGILQHIVDNQISLPAEGLPNVPDYDEKIRFNEISTAASLLKVGNFQNAAVDQYFNRHGEFTRTDIRNRLAQYYEHGKVAIAGDADTDTSLGDRVFFGLLHAISPNADKQVQDAAIVLIAYFFEKCDVFEDPNE